MINGLFIYLSYTSGPDLIYGRRNIPITCFIAITVLTTVNKFHIYYTDFVSLCVWDINKVAKSTRKKSTLCSIFHL